MTTATRIRPARRATRPASAWVTHRKGEVEVLQAAALKRLPWLVHGFSTRTGGTSILNGHSALNLGFTKWDTRTRVRANRQKLLAALDGEEMALVTLKQIHSDFVHRVPFAPGQALAFPSPVFTATGDALLTRKKGLLLAVQTADCVPILLVDTTHRAVAAVHAGWRGTLKRIAAKTLGRMRMAFGTRPEQVIAVLGPTIGRCCYEVGPEVARAFASQFARATDWFDPFETEEEPNPLQWLSMMPPGHPPPPKKSQLDLITANAWQLTDAGVPASSVIASPLCTACRRDLFFSYRREGAGTGRLMAVIGIRETR
ncbi:MAG TPA: peptidoglycan editing factor PgeF [Candidatus Acidoferrales bacterium]|nr:peptidoglycan editing factor PgeF [Candidatus Acidoferrales bacterium]